MKKTIIARILAAALSATLAMGFMVSGVGTTTIQVQAATKESDINKALQKAFDAKFYANKYADVKAAFGTDSTKLFKHFMTSGMKEGRMINANFDPKAYIEAYPDIKAFCKGDYVKAYDHYFTNGIYEGRTLTTFEDINKKKQAEAAAAAAAEAERIKNSTYQVDIGHGLTVTLNSSQYNSCTINVMKSDEGFGAYIGNDLYATSGDFDSDGVWHYSTVYVRNGNYSETLHAKPQVKKQEVTDDEYDAFLFGLMLAAMLDEADQQAQAQAQAQTAQDVEVMELTPEDIILINELAEALEDADDNG